MFQAQAMEEDMVEGVNCDQRYQVEPGAVIDLCDISVKRWLQYTFITQLNLVE